MSLFEYLSGISCWIDAALSLEIILGRPLLFYVQRNIKSKIVPRLFGSFFSQIFNELAHFGLVLVFFPNFKDALISFLQSFLPDPVCNFFRVMLIQSWSYLVHSFHHNNLLSLIKILTSFSFVLLVIQ